jgi:hypothetical protein
VVECTRACADGEYGLSMQLFRGSVLFIGANVSIDIKADDGVIVAYRAHCNN